MFVYLSFRHYIYVIIGINIISLYRAAFSSNIKRKKFPVDSGEQGEARKMVVTAP